MVIIYPMGAHDLKTLFLSHHPLLVMETIEEDQALLLLADTAAELALPAFEWSPSRGLCRMGETTLIAPKTECPVEALRHIEQLTVEAAFVLKDIGPHLEDPILQRLLRDLCAKFRHSRSCLVLTGGQIPLPPELRHDAVWFQVELPNTDELGAIFDRTLQGLEKRCFPVDEVSSREELIEALRGMTRNQARQSIIRAAVEDHRLNASDLADLQKTKAAAIRDGGLLEFYPAGEEEQVNLGGFNRFRAWLERMEAGFSTQAQALNLDPPKGVLLLGVQGCGKSLAAKIIAQQWNYPLLRLDAGRLYDKYIGESEKNFRRALEIAEAMSPCVLWIDELEKAFASGNGETGDGATSKRILASLLTWLQENQSGVFVVATANEIEQVPPELMRKGRFDEVFFVDLPTRSERLQIWRIHLEHRKQDLGNFDLGQLVSATEGFSGAEIEQVIVSALFHCLDQNVPLSGKLLLQEVCSTVPLSISRSREVGRLRRNCLGRFVLASDPEEGPRTQAA